MASAQKMIAIGDEDLVLNLEDEESAALKSDLAPLVGTAKKSGYQVAVRRQHEVHGKFEPYRSAEASLLALKISPRADSIDDRIESFTVKLRFEPATDGDLDDDPPYVVAYAPAQEGDVSLSENSTKITKTRSLAFTGSGQPPVGGASLSLTASGSTQKEFTQRDLYELQTDSWPEPMSLSEPNVVRWRMKAATQFEGVGDSIGVSVLLRRARSSRFSVRLEVKADVGFRARMSEKLSNLNPRKKEQGIKLGPFGPVKGAEAVPDGQTIPEGVDPTNLHDASLKNLLDKLAFVHRIETLESKQFYSKAADPPSALATKPEPKAPDTDTSAPTTQAPTTAVDPIGELPAVAAAQTVSASSTKKVSVGLPITPPANTASPARPSIMLSSSRAMRHRKMAALYQRLAQLHREEAEEAEALEGSQYADEVEREEALS